MLPNWRSSTIARKITYKLPSSFRSSASTISLCRACKNTLYVNLVGEVDSAEENSRAQRNRGIKDRRWCDRSGESYGVYLAVPE